LDADSIAAFWDPITKAGNKTAMIHAGLELQVWAKIAAGYHTANVLAGHEGWDPTGTRALLDALLWMRRPPCELARAAFPAAFVPT